MIRSAADVIAHLGAEDERGASRRLYKDTSCGAWLDLSDSRAALVGSIVEGSDVEPVVGPRRLWYPFDAATFDAAVAAIEADVDVVWHHVNECPDDCDGGCGYTDHAGALPVDLGTVPRPSAPRRYRVSLARSVVGWVPVTVRDLRAHRSLPVRPLPETVRSWLGCQGPRDAVPYESDEGAILASLAAGTSTEHEARRRGHRLWLTTDAL